MRPTYNNIRYVNWLYFDANKTSKGTITTGVSKALSGIVNFARGQHLETSGNISNKNKLTKIIDYLNWKGN